jgi:hypothetical protein
MEKLGTADGPAVFTRHTDEVFMLSLAAYSNLSTIIVLCPFKGK